MADAQSEGMEPPLTLVQLNHAGMQSSAPFSVARSPLAPAIAPVSGRPSLGQGALAWAVERVLWPTASRAVTDPVEWCKIAVKFADAAACMEEAGWGGVQVHAAHGYLLAEYLSPLVSDIGCSANCRPILIRCHFPEYQVTSLFAFIYSG